jgi:hypothetical protein
MTQRTATMCARYSSLFPTGVDGHAEVGRVRKLDLEDLGFFLGCDNVNHMNVRNGWPMRQLPLLPLSILQPVRRLEILYNIRLKVDLFSGGVLHKRYFNVTHPVCDKGAVGSAP